MLHTIRRSLPLLSDVHPTHPSLAVHSLPVTQRRTPRRASHSHGVPSATLADSSPLLRICPARFLTLRIAWATFAHVVINTALRTYKPTASQSLTRITPSHLQLCLRRTCRRNRMWRSRMDQAVTRPGLDPSSSASPWSHRHVSNLTLAHRNATLLLRACTASDPPNLALDHMSPREPEGGRVRRTRPSRRRPTRRSRLCSSTPR